MGYSTRKTGDHLCYNNRMNIYLLQGLALGFAAMAQPGPFMAYLVTQTITHGFRKTWIIAFAPLISDGPIIALALLVRKLQIGRRGIRTPDLLGVNQTL